MIECCSDGLRNSEAIAISWLTILISIRPQDNVIYRIAGKSGSCLARRRDRPSHGLPKMNAMDFRLSTRRGIHETH